MHFFIICERKLLKPQYLWQTRDSNLSQNYHPWIIHHHAVVSFRPWAWPLAPWLPVPLPTPQEVAPLAPKKITIPDPNNIGPMTTWPPRKPGAIYMGGFRAPKLDKVRVAFVGVGERGSMHVGQMAVIEGAEIVGICDLYEDWAKRSADVVEKKTGKRPPFSRKDRKTTSA